MLTYSVARSAALAAFVWLVAGAAQEGNAVAAPSNVSFAQSALSVDAYDFVEVAVNVADPDTHNPFIDVSVRGSFEASKSGGHWQVDGFCDSRTGRFTGSV